MKVTALSDLHGVLLPVEDFKPCELICICGDISPLNIQGNHRRMRQWAREVFKPWCESLPCDKVIFIAGNHDSFAQNLDFMYTQFPKDSKVTYLFHEPYIYVSKSGKEYSIFGTPYCKLFGNWAFMEMDEILEKLYSTIPENLDLLLTHDAPFGVSDVLLQKVHWNTGEHIGNKPLAKAILEKNPKIALHGHLHSTSREFEELGYSKVTNCSINDEYYKPVYKPITIDI